MPSRRYDPMKLLIINPGGASTKIAVYEDEQESFKASISHTAEDLKDYPHVFDQYAYRRGLIVNEVEKAGYRISEFDCFVGRGGLMRSIPGGTYTVNEQMIEDLKNAVAGEHASNLGAVIAKDLGDEYGKPSYVVDPVAVDEMMEKAGISGITDLERPSWFHALNQKAVARWVAEKYGKKYADMNMIVAHLGSGNSIVAHKNGLMVDGTSGRTNGAFSPERCGGLPTYPLIELCYSGKYTHEEMVHKISGLSGFYDYLGTKDAQEIEERISRGDEKARLVYDAYTYAVAKEICSLAAVFEGNVDCIVLTGGISHSSYVTDAVRQMTSFLAPVEVVAGEFEMTALALGALRVLRGEEESKVY